MIDDVISGQTRIGAIDGHLPADDIALLVAVFPAKTCRQGLIGVGGRVDQSPIGTIK